MPDPTFLTEKNTIEILLGILAGAFGGPHAKRGIGYIWRRANGNNGAANEQEVQTVAWCKSVHKNLENKLEERHQENMVWRKENDEKVARIDTNVAILLDRSDRDGGDKKGREG